MIKIGTGSMSVRLTALLLALWMIACAFAGCAQTPEEPEDSESESITLDSETESTGETETETDPSVIYTYDLNRIHIVRPKARNTQMDNAVAVLSEALIDAGVDGFEVGDDYELTEDPSRLEILIGDTNQPLSAEAKKHLRSGEEFIIAFYENKIVIQVMENENLEFAACRFSEILAAKTQGGVLTVSKSDTVIAKGNFIVLELVKDKKPVFNVVIPGMASAHEVEENAGVSDMEGDLQADELAEIEQVRRELGNHFCRRCNYCAPCAAGISIPSIFLFGGYLERYGLEDWARSRYAALDKTASDCIGCGVCEGRCPYELPIREMMKKYAEAFGK